MEPKETSKKRFYLKWPWNVIVYVLLVVVLRIFAIPLILLIMWWNRRQQPDGPEEGYCLQRTRGRLTGLIPAHPGAADRTDPGRSLGRGRRSGHLVLRGGRDHAL